MTARLLALLFALVSTVFVLAVAAVKVGILVGVLFLVWTGVSYFGGLA